MKVRSITCFADNKQPAEISKCGALLTQIRAKLTNAGFAVQTLRLAVSELTLSPRDGSPATLLANVREVEQAAKDAGIDYVSIGPQDPALAPEIIGATSVVFTSARIDTPSLWPIARAVKTISTLTPDGFGNLRFAALAATEPGIPFFPAAYAEVGNKSLSFALALECADLARDAVRDATGDVTGTRQHGRFENVTRHLKAKIEKHAAELERVLNDRDIKAKAAFTGCDWSLAPHPDESCSIGKAIEDLSGVKFGEFGTLTAVAALTNAIQTAKVRRVGFCGVFMPMLEDAILAKRAGPDFDLQKILLYSSVCGTGLDTIPLAGDVSEEAIAALLLDLATLARIKQKPLTARLMPVPGLKAGDMTQFNFPYLVNGRVFKL